MPQPTQDSFDAIVVGAGPAGCAASTILSEYGHRVALLEREPMPRYRVGESLIPHCWYPLTRLGLVDSLNSARCSIPKVSVQFVGTDGQKTRPFYFPDHHDHPKSHTWQVVRSEFDALLHGRAIQAGVQFFDQAQAKSLLRESDQVHARVTGVEILQSQRKVHLFAPVTLDASGRDLFSVTRNKWRVDDSDLHKLAIWRYFRDTHRESGRDASATTIAYLPEKGWIWHLPLRAGLTSIGVVAEPEYLLRNGRDLQAAFDRETSLQPWIADRLEGATQEGELHVTRDFAYRSRHCAQDGLVLTGDAFAFLDPVFSSGVYLALEGGVQAADAIHDALIKNDTRAASFADYGDRMCARLEPMRLLVHAFYEPTFHFGEFFRAHPKMRNDVTEVLIGNLERDFTDLRHALLEFAPVPRPLDHGRIVKPAN